MQYIRAHHTWYNTLPTVEISLYGCSSDTPFVCGVESETHFRWFCDCTLHHLSLVQTHLGRGRGRGEGGGERGREREGGGDEGERERGRERGREAEREGERRERGE